jgi:hypothetical protein
MKNKDLNALYYAHEEIEALEKLEQIKIFNFSKLSEESRDQMISYYQERSGSKKIESTIQVNSFADLAGFL